MYRYFTKKKKKREREAKGLNIPRAEVYLAALLEVSSSARKYLESTFWERGLAAGAREETGTCPLGNRTQPRARMRPRDGARLKGASCPQSALRSLGEAGARRARGLPGARYRLLMLIPFSRMA